MTLSENDGKLFYQLWFPLLDFVNQTMRVCEDQTKMEGSNNVDPEKAKQIADALWDQPDIIDEYLKNRPDLPNEHRDIIAGWKRCVTGRFFMERHLKKGSVFIRDDMEEVFLVKGIISPWEEMFFYRDPPILMDMTLIPFRDDIISDGLVYPYNVVFGGHIKSELKQTYMSAKNNGLIHKSL